MKPSMNILLTLSITAVLLVAASAPAFQPPPRAPGEFHLQAESPQFWNLVDHNAKLSVVGTGFGFTEGPVWDQAGFLYVSDETTNKIYRLHSNGKQEEVIALGDPDGNTWLLQEITTRLPGRVDSDDTAFSSPADLAAALRRAAAAHGEHEKRTGAHDENWPDWYAEYMVAEQSGRDFPT